MAAKNGDLVRIDYEGSLDDGAVFDSSAKHGKPLEFRMGEGRVIKGFESAVMGMKVGDEKKVVIQPCDAYGERNPQLVKKVPRSQMPPQPEPAVGMVLVLTTPEGMQFPAVITEVSGGVVTIDLNHPMAGKVLHFKIKLIEIVAGTAAPTGKAAAPAKAKTKKS